MGPALFIGLTAYMIVSSGFVEKVANPSERMKVTDVQTKPLPAPKQDAPQERLAALMPPALRAEKHPLPTNRTEHLPRADLPLARQNPRELKAQLWDGSAPPNPPAEPKPRVPTPNTQPTARSAFWLPNAPGTDISPRAKAAPLAKRAPPALPLVRTQPTLSPSAPYEQATAPPPLPQVVLSGDRVHLRSAPNTQSEIRATLPRGQRANVVSIEQNWIELEIAADDGSLLRGWMFRRYVQPVFSEE